MSVSKIKDTEYMYASARLHVLENRMIGRERVEALCDAKSRDEVLTRLAEYGIPMPEEGGEEAALCGVLQRAYAEVADCVPDAAVFDWIRYPYDCNNLKMALKCHIRGLSAEDTATMLFDFGTVPAPVVSALIEAETMPTDAPVPPRMRDALSEARTAYAKTGDPRQIDLKLDAACYGDMLDAATATGQPALIGWVKLKIDLSNYLITLRVLRLSLGAAAESFLSEALLPGGELDVSRLREVLTAEDGETALLWRLRETRKPLFERLATRIEQTDSSLSAIETCCDDAFMEQVRGDARVPFGVTVPGGYLYGWETAVRNIRIILAAHDAGLSPAETHKRTRESYV